MHILHVIYLLIIISLGSKFSIPQNKYFLIQIDYFSFAQKKAFHVYIHIPTRKFLIFYKKNDTHTNQ